MNAPTIENQAFGPFPAPDEAATAAFGHALGLALRRGDVVQLFGDVGAGKTTLARAAIQGRLGRAEETPSPTFTLIQTYQADIPIYHADLYRLTEIDEIWELGLIDAFEDAAVFIEWPERLGALTPRRRLDVRLDPSPDGGRMISARSWGAGWRHVTSAFQVLATETVGDL